AGGRGVRPQPAANGLRAGSPAPRSGPGHAARTRAWRPGAGPRRPAAALPVAIAAAVTGAECREPTPMETTTRIRVQADPDVVFALAAAVEDWPRLLPHYRGVQVLRR